MKKIAAIVLGIILMSSVLLFGCNNDKDPVDPGKNPPEKPTSIPVLISQIYGRGFNKESDSNVQTPVSHSFVELYNYGDSAVDLKDYALHVGANGVKGSGEAWSLWNGMLQLTGSIPAKHSYLVVVSAGRGTTDANPEAQDPDLVITRFDQSWPSYSFDQDYVGFSNKNLKVCLKEGTEPLGSITNPFDTDGNGRRVQGYVDMMSVSGNDSTIPVDAFEYDRRSKADREREGAAEPQYAQNKHKAARRKFSPDTVFSDTDDAYSDTRIIDYRAKNISKIGLERYRPRSKEDGVWENFDDRLPNHLIINQIYGKNRKDNTNAPFSNSFVELYNPTEETISLAGYSLQAAQGAAADDTSAGRTWTKLNFADTDTVPPRHSYLVVVFGARTDDARVMFDYAAADKLWIDAVLPNKNLKVALMSNQTLLTMKNPFADNAPGYVDMIGITGNDADTPDIDGCENVTFGYKNGQSRQKAVRRILLSDTNVNFDDVEIIDYRMYNEETGSGITNAELALYRPKTAKNGRQWGYYIL